MKYADRSYAEIVSIRMMLNHFNPSNIQNLSNKSTINRFVNETFEEIIHFQNYSLSSKFQTRKIERVMQNLFFIFFVKVR